MDLVTGAAHYPLAQKWHSFLYSEGFPLKVEKHFASFCQVEFSDSFRSPTSFDSNARYLTETLDYQKVSWLTEFAMGLISSSVVQESNSF